MGFGGSISGNPGQYCSSSCWRVDRHSAGLHCAEKSASDIEIDLSCESSFLVLWESLNGSPVKIGNESGVDHHG